MPKSLKIYIGILLLILIGVVVIDANRPKPIDWRHTYSLSDKIPFGLYVFDNEYEEFFNPQKVEQFGKTPYEFFDSKFNYNDTTYSIKGTFLYIDNEFNLDEESVEELLYFASHGNDIFLSATSFPNKLKDSLNFKLEFDNNYNDSIVMSTTKTKVKSDSYFNKGINNRYFTELDSSAIVLGQQKRSSGKLQTNFIKIPYGNGNFFLHTQPIAFTNYYLLKDNYSYTEDILSYLPKTNNIYWKVRKFDSNNLNQSPLGFAFSQPALKWAWLFAIYGMIVFMFFNAKRRQRVIPIINPLRNTTVDFTKTIGNLYYQEKDYMNIIDKKIIFFLEKIRNDYYLDTFNLDDTFINRLHQKSGKSKDEVNQLIQLINTLRNKSVATENDVIALNEQIEKFYS